MSTRSTSAIVATFHGLLAVVVAVGVTLIATDPKYLAYALWTLADTGQLWAAGRSSFVLMLLWILAARRYRVGTRTAVGTTLGLFAAALVIFAADARSSMAMGNSQYVHFLPATWSLMMAWAIGTATALAVMTLVGFGLQSRLERSA